MMKRFSSVILILVFACLSLAMSGSNPGPALAGPEPSDDQTLSPYFFVQGGDPDTDRLPLKSTRADVRIAGVIADVTITQVYKNEGKSTLEAIYVFPGSTRAAVYFMQMTVGERIIVAEIKERQEARAIYEQAKANGQTASLLEQQRPNVFQMNVANILPGDEIKVEMKYTELITPEDNVYEFVFPTIVGPRYSNTPAAGAPDTEKWVENPYLQAGEGAPYTFGLSVDIKTAIPISKLASPGTDLAVEYQGQTQAHITPKDPQKAALKDFVLRYQLAGGKIETGLLLYPGEKENFFLMMMEPPSRVSSDEIMPREYIFIVDVSGSMNGFPLNDVGKPLMREIISNLRPNDFMNVLLFAGGSAVLSESGSLPADSANKQKAINWIDSQQAGGGTEILPALQRALALPRTEGVSRIVVVVTDGYVSVEPQVFELIRKNLGEANLFTFGIGSSVNRHLIEGMARAGLGEPFIVLNPSEGKKQAARFREYIQSPVLTDIKVQFQGFNAYDVEPVAVPDLFALRPIIVFGKYRGQAKGQIVVSGRTTQGAFSRTVNLADGLASKDNAALRLLWARHRIMRLADMNNLVSDEKRTKEVTALGLEYSIMTQYTSFVAVDKVKRADGRLVTVKQPLPLPEGVPDSAVGQSREVKSSLAPAPTMADSSPAGGLGGTQPVEMVKEPMEEHAPAKPAAKKELGIDFTIEEIRGPLSRAALEKALENLKPQLAQCIKDAGARKVMVRGEATYKLTIDANGRVTDVTLVTATQHAPGDGTADGCFRKAFRSLSLGAAPKASCTVTIKLICQSS